MKSIPHKTLVMTGASGGVGRAILDTLRGDDVALYLVANNGADALRRNLADSQSPTLRDAKVLRADLSQIGAAQTLADALLHTLREDRNARTARRRARLRRGNRPDDPAKKNLRSTQDSLEHGRSTSPPSRPSQELSATSCEPFVKLATRKRITIRR